MCKNVSIYLCICVSLILYILRFIPNDVLTGADIASGPVWMEYISFLKSLPVCIINLTLLLLLFFWQLGTNFAIASNICFGQIQLQAANAQEESQRMTAVRKVYQKAIITPTHHIEQLWKDYENFENSVSRQLVLCWS